jgi:hypothetical protein
MDTKAIDALLVQYAQERTPVLRQERRTQLIDAINYLLVNDFHKLVVVLYRVDVSEPKLKKLLQANPKTDAAVIIADLLIERQAEKIKTRESFKGKRDIPEDEKW